VTQTPTDALRLVPDEEQIFAWLNRKYVQRAEERQRSMNLQYMEAETHDLSASLHRWLLAAAPASPLPGGGLEPLSDDPAVASMCDSSYRAGALAGWNAAHHSDPEEGERIMSRIRSVEPGSLAPIVERNRARQQVREYDFKAEDEWFEPLPAAPTGEPK